MKHVGLLYIKVDQRHCFGVMVKSNFYHFHLRKTDRLHFGASCYDAQNMEIAFSLYKGYFFGFLVA